MRIMILSIPTDGYARMILAGEREDYIRTTSTYYRGRLGLYARVPDSRPEKMWRRGLVGLVELVGVEPLGCSGGVWKGYQWRFSNPVALAVPVVLRAVAGLFAAEVDDALLEGLGIHARRGNGNAARAA